MYWKTSLGPDDSQETDHGASGESRVPLLKIPNGALNHHRPEAGGGSPCGARRASAARLTHISHADSDQHGKYAIGMILMLVNRVCKPATGSFAGEDACGHPSLLF